jgi:beta-lactamase class A
MKLTHISRRIAIVLCIVVAVAIVCGIFFMIRSGSLSAPESASQYPYLDPAQSLYNDADLLVNMHPLAQELTGLTQGNNNIEIYFQYLDTGSDISLMKVPIAMAVMKKVESGEWSMNDELSLTDADKNPNYGTLYQLPSGTKFTVAGLLQELLVQSDDTARAIFVRTLGEQSIEDVLDYLGLQDVVDNNDKITAQRYSNFWRALYSAGYLSADGSQTLLQIMAEPHDPELLSSGMPKNVLFAHKMGVFGDTYADSGIVYVPGRPYILSVMIVSSSTDEVHALMKSISQDVYQYITTSNGK